MLVHDDKPNGFWRLTKVNHLLTGKDELVRDAVVRITSGKDQVIDLQRPLQLLYPLDVDCCVTQSEVTHQDAEEKSPEVVTSNPQEPCKGCRQFSSWTTSKSCCS